MMTWTHKNGNFWPKTQLKSNAPEARILIYSYNSQVALDVSTSGIEDHAESLLDRLDGLRDEKVQQVCYAASIESAQLRMLTAV
jgi:hypothetical protein